VDEFHLALINLNFIQASKLFADSRDSMLYDSYVNVPFGVSRYKSKLFVTVPRHNPGIPATLNVVELKGNPPYINPLLVGYPSYQMNSLSVS
jgi:dopachrome tautomerase